MDISELIINKYDTLHLCFGKTCKGRRCRRRTKNAYKCYGIELPVCNYHHKQNVIYRWSTSRNQNITPEKIKSYLTFYNHCIKCKIDKWIAVLVATELYKTTLFLSGREILQLFRNSIFKTIEGECGVCYDTYNNALQTRCGHIFCESCLTNWTTSHVTCPMCRKLISQS